MNTARYRVSPPGSGFSRSRRNRFGQNPTHFTSTNVRPIAGVVIWSTVHPVKGSILWALTLCCPVQRPIGRWPRLSRPSVRMPRAHPDRTPRPLRPGASLSALNKFRPTAQAPRPAPNVWDEMCTELVQEVGSHLRIDDKAALANTAAGFKARLPGAAEEQGLYSRAMRQTPADHLMRPDVKASDYQIGTALTALDKTVHPQDRTALTDRMLSAAEIGVSMLQAPAVFEMGGSCSAGCYLTNRINQR